MAKTSAAPNRELLEAALQGLEAQRQKLDEQIAQVRDMIGQRPGRSTYGAGGSQQATGVRGGARKKRILSPEARKRIAAAQRKRWAAFRKAQA